MPELADRAADSFGEPWRALPRLPRGRRAAVSFFFEVHNGRSSGEKNYQDGDTPYVERGRDQQHCSPGR